MSEEEHIHTILVLLTIAISYSFIILSEEIQCLSYQGSGIVDVMIMCGGGGTKKSAPIRKGLNHLCNNSLLLICTLLMALLLALCALRNGSESTEFIEQKHVRLTFSN
jgi:hypothetical protein